jgi:hypothetical protein
VDLGVGSLHIGCVPIDSYQDPSLIPGWEDFEIHRKLLLAWWNVKRKGLLTDDALELVSVFIYQRRVQDRHVVIWDGRGTTLTLRTTVIRIFSDIVRVHAGTVDTENVILRPHEFGTGTKRFLAYTMFHKLLWNSYMDTRKSLKM